MRVPLCVLAGIAALALPALPQTGGASFSGRLFYAGTVIAGAPYSAERVFERVQTAADGARFNEDSHREKIWRDSAGRTRIERALLPGPDAPAGVPVVVEIRDPVAHAGYVLDAQHKIAHRVALEFPRMAAPRESNRIPPQEQTEELGQRIMEGVAAQGRRVTDTWPAGSQGNDRPYQVVSESWFSPEIRDVVMSRLMDPLNGETTITLIGITPGEPDPSLFQPPPDYSVVNETGPFQIQWTAPRQ